MKKVLLLALGVIGCVGVANADAINLKDKIASNAKVAKVKPVSEGLTVQDLVEGFGIATIQEGRQYGGYIGSCGGCSLQAVPGEPNSVIVTNFYEEDSGISFKFTLRNGNELVYVGGTPSVTKNSFSLSPLVYSGGSYGFLNGNSSSEWVGTIKENSYGDGYVISFGPFGMFYNGQSAYNYQELGYKNHLYHSFTLETHEVSFIVTDDVCPNDYQVEKSREYYMALYQTNSIWLLNLANNGYCVNSSGKGRFELLVDSDGDYVFERQPAIGGPNINSYGNYRGNWYWYDYVGYYNGDLYTQFYGVESDYADHVPNHNHWAEHVPGGTLKTVVGWRIDVDPYTTYNSTTGINYIYKNTKMYYGEYITPEINIEMDEHGYGSEAEYGVYFKGKIIPNVSETAANYIDHYELHMVQGIHDTVLGKSTNSSTGLSNGISIHSDEHDVAKPEGQKVVALAASNPTDEIQFEKLITPDKLGSHNYTQGHTLYVKTVYTAASGLTPSFHALTPLRSTTTAVDEITTENNDVMILIDGTNITINGSEGNAMVCTMAGVVVYQGGDATISVEPGMYIVRAGKTAKRVIVK